MDVRCGGYSSSKATRASSTRDLTPSLTKALRRCELTVCGATGTTARRRRDWSLHGRAERRDRPGVGPLQIVHDHQEGCLHRRPLEHVLQVVDHPIVETGWRRSARASSADTSGGWVSSTAASRGASGTLCRLSRASPASGRTPTRRAVSWAARRRLLLPIPGGPSTASTPPCPGRRPPGSRRSPQALVHAPQDGSRDDRASGLEDPGTTCDPGGSAGASACSDISLSSRRGGRCLEDTVSRRRRGCQRRPPGEATCGTPACVRRRGPSARSGSPAPRRPPRRPRGWSPPRARRPRRRRPDARSRAGGARDRRRAR